MKFRDSFLGVGLNVFFLGLVSFLTDVSSEMIMPILPLFIYSLGGAGIAIGLIAGFGDSISSILKVFSGYWSDKTGRRLPYVFAGYASSAVAKIFFPLSTHWLHLLLLRPIERVGKGIRTAPRDALIADSLKSEVMGRGFGFHRAMDTAGAVLGSLLAFLLVWVWGWSLRAILLVAAIVAFLALIPLLRVREVSAGRSRSLRVGLRLSLKGLPRKLKLFILAATLFALAEFSYMFFILRAREAVGGLGVEAIAFPILLYVLFNIFYAVFAFPAGMLSDKIGKRKVIIVGYVLFATICLCFAASKLFTLYILLFALYGLVYALLEGNIRAYTAELSPSEIRGTALGTLHTAIGLAALPSNMVAGILWEVLGSTSTFIYGAVLAAIASIILAKA